MKYKDICKVYWKVLSTYFHSFYYEIPFISVVLDMRNVYKSDF